MEGVKPRRDQELTPSTGATITTNDPSEKLSKLLESSDSTKIMMGLAQAKDGGSDEFVGKILWLYMFSDNALVRKLAKSAFLNLAPEDAKQVVKANWKDKYRTQSFSQIISDTSIKDFTNCKVGDYGALDRGRYPAYEKKLGHVSVIENRGFILGAYIHPVTLLISHDLSSTSVSIIEPFCRELEGGEFMISLVTVKALGMICDVQAVEPLIKTLDSDAYALPVAAAKALGKIGDKRAIEPLVKLKAKKSIYPSLDRQIQEATFKALDRLS